MATAVLAAGMVVGATAAAEGLPAVTIWIDGAGHLAWTSLADPTRRTLPDDPALRALLSATAAATPGAAIELFPERGRLPPRDTPADQALRRVDAAARLAGLAPFVLTGEAVVNSISCRPAGASLDCTLTPRTTTDAPGTTPDALTASSPRTLPRADP